MVSGIRVLDSLDSYLQEKKQVSCFIKGRSRLLKRRVVRDGEEGMRADL